MSNGPFRVTDHALVRYLERVDGVDVERARRALRRAAELAEKHEGVSSVVCLGVRFYFRHDALTTVLQANRPDLRTGRQRKGHRHEGDEGDPT